MEIAVLNNTINFSYEGEEEKNMSYADSAIIIGLNILYAFSCKVLNVLVYCIRGKNEGWKVNEGLDKCS